MAEKKSSYLSYLLRLWETDDGGKRIWRASLERPGTGERRGFANLQDLFDFLEAQTGQPPSSDETNRDFERRDRRR